MGQNKKKYNPIPDEAFKEGAKLIVFKPPKTITKKRKEKIEQEIEALEAEMLVGEDVDEQEIEFKIKYITYKDILKCPYCKDGYIRNIKELKKHNVDKQDFIKKYGGTSPKEMVAYKIMKWYSPDRKRWALQQADRENKYITFNTDTQKEKNEKNIEKHKPGERIIFTPEYLTISMLKGHLNHKHTVAIYPWGTHAGWMCIDVDTNEEAFDDMKKIVNVMTKYGIDRKNILVSFSGEKGYHVEIFFEYPVTYKRIEKIANKICYLAGLLEKRQAGKIEARPTKKKGIKLPFGKHKLTNRLSHVLDENFDRIYFYIDEYKFFLNMDKVSIDLLFDILKVEGKVKQEKYINPDKEKKKNNKHKQQINKKHHISKKQFKNKDIDSNEAKNKIDKSAIYTVEFIKDAYYNGLNKNKTRHFIEFNICIWMRDYLKYDKDKAEEKLFEWIYKNEKFINNMSDAEKDTESILYSVYDSKNRNKYKIKIKTTSIIIYKEDIEFIKQIQQEAILEKKARTIAPSLLYFSFLFLKRYFNSNPFFVSRDDLKKYSTLKSNKIFINWFNWLLKKEYIIITTQGNYNLGYSNEYLIKETEIKDTNNYITIEVDINKELNLKEIYNEFIK